MTHSKGDQRVTKSSAQAPTTVLDWRTEADQRALVVTNEQKARLATDLGVTVAALDTIGVGWANHHDLRRLKAGGAGWSEHYPEGAYCFPERDGGGRIVGLSLRAPDGRKGSPASSLGASRGLIIPNTLRERPDPVLVVEGASDVAACEVLRIAAVGRPSNCGGAEEVARLLDSREVRVVGERDQKSDGAWPGRDGAKAVATRLAATWETTISWTLPPAGAKDIRDWLQSRVKAGLNLNDTEACAAAGRELLAALSIEQKTAKPKKLPQAEHLVRLANELFRVGLTDGDEAFAVRRDGANIALMFRGLRGALRATLSHEYRRRTGRTPSAAALADAMTALEGAALEYAPEPVHLRLAAWEGGIVLDLGDATGRAVVIRGGRWEVLDASPVLFKRTGLTAPLPEPERGNDLSALRELLNIDEESWPLLLGWLVAGFIPGIPHPILLLGGEQGTGKSTAARLVVGILDPSPAPLRSEPKDERDWATAAAGSWAIAIDNVSRISPWWSDALCRIVTGDGWVARKLYTDSDVSVLSYRRVVLLTTIDAGALRGDLGDRLLLVDLERIDNHRRRPEVEIFRVFEESKARIFGAVLDLAAAVLTELQQVALLEHSRMADFCRVLAALDAVMGTKALDTYMSQGGRIAADVLEADPVGQLVAALADRVGTWSGTATELLKEITPERPGPGWPRVGRALSARIKRLVPALRALGVAVTFARKAGGKRERTLKIEKMGISSSRSSRTGLAAAGDAHSMEVNRDANGTNGTGISVAERVPEPRHSQSETTIRDDRDSRDAKSPNTSCGSTRDVIEI